MLAPFTTINETDNLPHITTNDNPLIVPSEILWELLHGRLPRSSWTCSLTVDSFTWKKLAEKTLGILQTLHSYQDLPLYLSRSPKCGLFLGTVKQDSPVQATQPVIASCQYHPRLKWYLLVYPICLFAWFKCLLTPFREVAYSCYIMKIASGSHPQCPSGLTKLGFWHGSTSPTCSGLLWWDVLRT